MEWKIPPGQELRCRFRDHPRVEDGAASRARSFAKLVLDDNRRDACRTGPVDADGIEEDCRSKSMEAETRDHLRTSATAPQR